MVIKHKSKYDFLCSMKILCTSLKDALSLRFILGVETYSYQSESYIPDTILPDTTHICIDNDETGVRYGNTMKEKFGLEIIKPLNKDVFDDLKEYKDNIQFLKNIYLYGL